MNARNRFVENFLTHLDNQPTSPIVLAHQTLLREYRDAEFYHHIEQHERVKEWSYLVGLINGLYIAIRIIAESYGLAEFEEGE